MQLDADAAYAIGDVHGQRDKLVATHRLIEADRAAHGGRSVPVVHLGDLVDRGPDSAGVVQDVLDGIEAGRPWHVIKGNHDRMMQLFLRDPPERDPGLREGIDWWTHHALGGRSTLASYGITNAAEAPPEALHARARAAVPTRHREFLEDLPAILTIPGFAFVHAGIRPGVPLDRQSEDDLVWIRDTFLNDTRDHGVIVVHGHTPVEEVMHCGNRVDIDTGAGFGRALSAVYCEAGEVWLLTDGGRQRLTAP